MNKNCDICGQTYIAKNGQSLFCSTECKRLGRNRQLNKQSLEKRKGLSYQCTYCQKKYIPCIFTKKENHFCSKECKGKFQHIKAKNNHTRTSDKIKQLIKESKLGQGSCENCGETDIRIFEFAHYPNMNKVCSIANANTIQQTKEELTKGRWLCVWCHRIETSDDYHTTNKLRQSRKDYVDGVKRNIGQCQMCEIAVEKGFEFCFEFDHINQGEKVDSISNLILNSIEIIDKEIQKCRLLCCQCHRLHTIEQAKENMVRKKIFQNELPFRLC